MITRELDRATFEAFVAAQERGEPFALALGIDPPYTMRVLHDDDAINRCDERTFVLRYGPPPRMYVIGAVDVARPLLTYAKTLGLCRDDRRSARAVRGAVALSRRRSAGGVAR